MLICMLPARRLLMTLMLRLYLMLFFFSSRRRHTRLQGDWSSDVCSSDLGLVRCTPFLALVIVAGCARPPRVAAPAQPGLFGPASQPVLLPPRLVEADVPRTDAQWRAVGREAATLLSQYVAINTTNPPGNELQTAHWLKAVLAREGIEAQVLEPQAGEGEPYAPPKGDGSAPPPPLLHPNGVGPAAP